MSNPTTPFNWQMPTNTDLVTDLPADFEVFGQAVATSMADLLGGTTGQILSKATNTNMDFVWINNDQGDITGITATSPLTGGGTSGAVTVGIQSASTTQSGAVQLENSTSSTSTTTAAVPASVKSAFDLATTANSAAGAAQTTANAAIPKSTVTTSGDVIYATGSSAVTRLGIGSSGQVLTVSGGVPAWAAPAGSGGQTTLASGTLSGTTVLSSISSGYKDLRLILRNVDMTGDCQQRITVNSVTVYRYSGVNSTDNTATAIGATAATFIPLNVLALSGSSTNNSAMINFYDYATSGSGNRMIDAVMDGKNSSSQETVFKSFGVAVTTAAISSITITPSANAYTTGTYELIGIK
ncbi:Bacteriophage lambda, Stf, side tail fibre-repeat-2 [uncultured Caudovirales phage]|uniref:Bacteriophage lambda, Stf, side tail fibre-repeat-2 n=1 Tax=uncultured Caudovirales phage TaxID=2100421 RepID=A0A6J5T7E4_9CAUD|nr:Bacteriophage lambda, Stf, side tail fibre-repeat-2 [uncultured Caudovirales phage]